MFRLEKSMVLPNRSLFGIGNICLKFRHKLDWTLTQGRNGRGNSVLRINCGLQRYVHSKIMSVF